MARGAEIGAGAVTVEDVTGDAQSPAPGKLIIILLEFKKHRNTI